MQRNSLGVVCCISCLRYHLVGVVISLGVVIVSTCIYLRDEDVLKELGSTPASISLRIRIILAITVIRTILCVAIYTYLYYI